MKILITGDISTWNIDNFNISNMNQEYVNRIKDSDHVIYNLEGPILGDGLKPKIQYRKFFLTNMIFNLMVKALGKEQPLVSSDESIGSLLNLNSSTSLVRANNHVKDGSEKGFLHTNRFLEENNIDNIGAEERSSEQNYELSLSDDIELLNFNFVGNKYGISLYNSSKFSYGATGKSLEEIDEIVQRHKDAGKKVILIIHYGRELKTDAKDLGIDFGTVKNISADISVIHHPHIYVESDFEKDNIFVIGDFVFSRPGKMDHNRTSALLEVEIDEEVFVEKKVFKVSDVYKY